MKTYMVNVSAKRYRKDMGDIQALADSIAKIGLLNPITIDKAGNLIAGVRRLEAVKLLGWEDIKAREVDIGSTQAAYLQAEYDENECRKGFTRSESVAIGRAVEEAEKRLAKERQRQHGGTAPGKKNTSVKSTEVNGEASERAAKSVGMSRPTYSQAKAVVEAAEEDQETFGPIVEEMDRTGKVSPAFKKVQEIKAPGSNKPGKENPYHVELYSWLRGQSEALDTFMITSDDMIEQEYVEPWEMIADAIDGLAMKVGRLAKKFRGVTTLRKID